MNPNPLSASVMVTRVLVSRLLVVVFMVSLSCGASALPYIYKFSDLRARVNLFANFFQSFFCYDLSALGLPFPLMRCPE